MATPVLALPRSEGYLTSHADVYYKQIVCVLMQHQTDWKSPLGCRTRKLKVVQQNCDRTHRECQVIIRAILSYDFIVNGKDHSS